MEAGKAEAQRSRIPMGLTGKMPRASREARAFSGTTVLFAPRPVYL